MLLDPLEEQLDLPAAPVELGDGQGRQGEVVGQEHKRFAVLGIEEADAAELLGIVLFGVEAVEDDDLVGVDAGRLSTGWE